MAIDNDLALDGVVDPEQQVQHGSLAEAGRAHDRICCARLDAQVQVLEQVSDLFISLCDNFLCIIFQLTIISCTAIWCLRSPFVAKAHILEFDEPLIKAELLGVRYLLYRRPLFEHIEELFNIDLALCHLTEEHSHVEKWTCQLHEVRLEKNKVTWRHGAIDYCVSCHQQVKA